MSTYEYAMFRNDNMIKSKGWTREGDKVGVEVVVEEEEVTMSEIWLWRLWRYWVI